MLADPFDDPIAHWRPSITTSRMSSLLPLLSISLIFLNYSTQSRKGFTSAKKFIVEPESREQCVALEENVKEFGLTYYGMADRRQGTAYSFSDLRFGLLITTSIALGIVHVIGPEQGFTVSPESRTYADSTF